MDRPDSERDPQTDDPSRHLRVNPWLSIRGATAGITGIRITIEGDLQAHSYTVGRMRSVTPAADVIVRAVTAIPAVPASPRTQEPGISEGPSPLAGGSSDLAAGQIDAAGVRDVSQPFSAPPNDSPWTQGSDEGSLVDRIEPGEAGDVEEYPEWMLAVLHQSRDPH